MRSLTSSNPTYSKCSYCCPARSFSGLVLPSCDSLSCSPPDRLVAKDAKSVTFLLSTECSTSLPATSLKSSRPSHSHLTNPRIRSSACATSLTATASAQSSKCGAAVRRTAAKAKVAGNLLRGRSITRLVFRAKRSGADNSKQAIEARRRRWAKRDFLGLRGAGLRGEGEVRLESWDAGKFWAVLPAVAFLFPSGCPSGFLLWAENAVLLLHIWSRWLCLWTLTFHGLCENGKATDRKCCDGCSFGECAVDGACYSESPRRA